MPSVQVHQRQAQHNEAFVRSFDLDTTPYLDWVVTAMFYAALHLIDAYLATKDVHFSTHRGRDSLIWAVRELRPIYGAYRRLKHRSEEARYEGVDFKPQQVRCLLSKELREVKDGLALLP